MKKHLFILSFLYFSIALVHGQSTLTSASQIPQQIYLLNTPVTIHESAKDVIFEKYQNLVRAKSLYEKNLSKCSYYFPQIEKAFEEAGGVPNDFKYLSMQESRLEADVVSSSQAVGFWQFKDMTAKERGLRVDDNPNLVDERMNIYAASKGAAEYFKKSYHYIHSWPYALLSYYTGLSGCLKHIKENQIDVHNVVLHKDSHFYLLHFVANYLAYKEYQAFEQQNNMMLISYMTYNTSLSQLSNMLGLDYNSMKGENIWIRQGDEIPGDKAYAVILPTPKDRSQELLAVLTPAGEEMLTRARSSYVYSDSIDGAYPVMFEDPTLEEKGKHRFIYQNGIKAIIAQKGDDIKTLASLGEVSKGKFKKFNDLKKDEDIEEGMAYYLDYRPKKIILGTYYYCRGGETASDVAFKYGMDTKSFMKLNGIKKNEVMPQGRKLYFN